MAKILLLDIETSPLVGYTWGLYEQDVIKRIKPFRILSFAYQWFGGKTKVIACDVRSEKMLLVQLHKLLSEADIVVAHNGDSFDVKKINARFIVHRFDPPSPYKTIDTKVQAKRIAAFDSNSLENLSVDMSEGEKIKHRGFPMWEGCMAGNQQDWNDMKRYNKKDVVQLSKIYLRLRSWMKNHPDVNHCEGGDKEACPKCGSKKTIRRGILYTKVSNFHRRQCKDCAGWFKGEKLENFVRKPS